MAILDRSYPKPLIRLSDVQNERRLTDYNENSAGSAKSKCFLNLRARQGIKRRAFESGGFFEGCYAAIVGMRTLRLRPRRNLQIRAALRIPWALTESKSRTPSAHPEPFSGASPFDNIDPYCELLEDFFPFGPNASNQL